MQTVDLNMEAWNLFEISQMRAVSDGVKNYFPFKGCLNDSGWRIIPGLGYAVKITHGDRLERPLFRIGLLWDPETNWPNSLHGLVKSGAY